MSDFKQPTIWERILLLFCRTHYALDQRGPNGDYTVRLKVKHLRGKVFVLSEEVNHDPA